MNITFLGTGDALATKIYNTCFVIDDGTGRMLVDGGGGNGVLTQLRKAGIDLLSIHDLFLTHAHTDHILGVIWVVRIFIQTLRKRRKEAESKAATASDTSIAASETSTAASETSTAVSETSTVSETEALSNCVLRVRAHREAMEILDYCLRTMLGKKIYSEVGQSVKLITVEPSYEFDFGLTHCRVFDTGSTKMKQYGFEAVLPDGERLVCLGDEPLHEENVAMATGADWLMHEAFCLYADRDIHHPYEKSHSTARDAAMNAERLGVKNLILYHTEDDTILTRKEAYTREAREFFSGNIFVPEDLEKVKR